MGRNEYEKDNKRERTPDSRSKSRSVSRSRSPRRKVSVSPRRESRYESSRQNTDKYYRRSRSPRMRYKRKTSRDNSAENEGNVLYVSNLPKRVKDDELRERISKHGQISSIHVVRDPFTKDCRGFGFVTMESKKDAENVIDVLNKAELGDKEIAIEISKRSRPHHSTPGVYLGPTIRKRHESPRRYYRSRAPRSRSRSYHRERSYRRPRHYSRSRSRSASYPRRRY